MFTITFSKKAREYLKEKEIPSFLIKISLFSEKCVQIYEPIIQPISREEIEKKLSAKEIIKEEGYAKPDIFYTSQFEELFKEQNEIQIERKRFPKKLVIQNIDPIIINTCRVDSSN